MVNILLNSLLMSGFFFFYGPTEKISDNYNFFFVGMIITAVAVVTCNTGPSYWACSIAYQ